MGPNVPSPYVVSQASGHVNSTAAFWRVRGGPPDTIILSARLQNSFPAAQEMNFHLLIDFLWLLSYCRMEQSQQRQWVTEVSRCKICALYGRQNVDSTALTTICGLYPSQAFFSLIFSVAGTPRLSVATFQASQTHLSTVPFFLLCNVLCLDANAVTLLLIRTSF